MHIASVEGAFSVGIFLFKKGATLPLHDHPDMSVYTRCAAPAPPAAPSDLPCHAFARRPPTLVSCTASQGGAN